MTAEESTLPVSVIVPARNTASVIGPCVRSLLNQAPEIIVVDDGSEDRTAEEAEQAGARVFRQGPRGPAAARNLGARHARGQILLFTDADCLASPAWVERMMEPFQDPTVSGVKGAYETKQIGWVPQMAQVEFEDRYRLLQSTPNIDMVDTHAAGFRKEVFLRHGGFDESFGVASNEDTEFSYRLAEAGERLVFQPKAVVFHGHPKNLWEYSKKKYGRGYWRMKAYAQHPDRVFKDSYTPQGLKLQILLLPIMALFFLLILLGWHTPGVVGLCASVVVFLGSSTALLKLARRRHRALLWIAPIFLLSRAFALGLGAGVGWCAWGRKRGS